MPRMPIIGSTWELREILPDSGEPYLASVARIRRDQDGRMLVNFYSEDGCQWESEVWLARPEEPMP